MKGFPLLLTHPILQTMHFFENLYNKASWFHTSNYTDHTDEYYFGSFWMDPPLASQPENKGRKCKTFTIQTNATSHNMKDHPIEHEGDSTNLSITNTSNPQTIDPSINNKELEHTIQLHSDPSIRNANSPIQAEPSICPNHIMDPSIHDSTLPSPSSRPIEPSDSEANSTNKPDSTQFTHNQRNPSTFKAQYNAFLGSPKYHAYKQQKGIDGHIYILHANSSYIPYQLPIRQHNHQNTSKFFHMSFQHFMIYLFNTWNPPYKHF
jgi:hypothetical protein